MYKFTVFTPTYNREKTLERVFESLCSQTFTNFEWILIDDGSIDNTPALIDSFHSRASFTIKHLRLEKNSGKHIAYNKALQMSDSELFTVVDSDDEIDPDALLFVNNYWCGLSSDQQKNLSGIYVRCKSQHGNFYAYDIKEEPIVTDDIEMIYKLKYETDFWGIRRTDVVKQFLFPEDFVGHYYPEGILFKKIGKHYKLHVVNKELYTVHYDGNFSLIRSQRPLFVTAKYVCVFAADHINNYLNYFFDHPVLFLNRTLYFWVYSFYTKNIAATWKQLNIRAVMWMILFLPAGIIAHIAFFGLRAKKYYLNRVKKGSHS